MKKSKIDGRLRWHPERVEELKALINDGLSNFNISKKLNVSVSSIEHAQNRFGIKRPQRLKNRTRDTDEPQVPLNQLLDRLLSKASSYKINREYGQIRGKGDTLVILLSDLHAGKVVKNQEGIIIYDGNIFRIRMDSLCLQILKLLDHNIRKGVPILNVVIISTGDQANGEDIYATQAYDQEIAPPEQVMLVVEVIQKLIMALMERKLPVTFYGVKGNHGRTGKDTNPIANWDLMIYKVLEYWSTFILKNPKLQIRYVNTDYMTFNIRNHGYMIRHHAPEQPDTPSGRVKFNEWARMHKAGCIVYGHWHHFGLFDVDGVRVIRGPSVVGGDDLSESMAKHSEPIQLVWGVNDKRVCTFFYAVDLKGKEI